MTADYCAACAHHGTVVHDDGCPQTPCGFLGCRDVVGDNTTLVYVLDSDNEERTVRCCLYHLTVCNARLDLNH